MKIGCFVIRPLARLATHGTVWVGMARMLKPNWFGGSFNAANRKIAMRARQRAVVDLANVKGDHRATLTEWRVIPKRAAIRRWEWPWADRCRMYAGWPWALIARAWNKATITSTAPSSAGSSVNAWSTGGKLGVIWIKSDWNNWAFYLARRQYRPDPANS